MSGAAARCGASAFRCCAGAPQAAVIFSTSPQVRSGPSRNGDPSLAHSALYKPMVVSARALSRASPAEPMEPARQGR
jgi:hypothetical protein